MTDIAARQAEVRERFRESFDTSRPVALVDYPNHNNCGDNAIWLGERAILDALGVEVATVSDQASYSAEEIRAAGVATVLIHGGGNFGSIWPEEQRFRERVVCDHPALPIIQLPQTIHFDDATSSDSARVVLGAHEHLKVLARDNTSLAVARDQLGLDVVCSPDAAFGLGRLRSDRVAQVPIVWMARTDGEGTITAPSDQADVSVVDWLRGNPFSRSAAPRAALTVRLRRLYDNSQRLSLARKVGAPLRARAFDALARRRVERGLDVLSYGEVVVTDRLHGHILCTLLGKPHVVLDTKHGKITSYLTAFPPPDGLVSVARSTDDALDLARGLVG